MHVAAADWVVVDEGLSVDAIIEQNGISAEQRGEALVRLGLAAGKDTREERAMGI